MPDLIRFEPWQREGGWRWAIDYGERVGQYRTDHEYTGLWARVEDGPSVEWRQSRGTLQYDLPEDRDKAIAKVLRDWQRRGDRMHTRLESKGELSA